MKKTLTTLAVAALAMLALSLGAGSALSAGSSPAHAKKIVPIVMHDPGCHWFSVGGKLKAKLTVRGATTFLNQDEAALIFKSHSLRQKVAPGRHITVTKAGHYKIWMVKQPSDDNTLKLIVK
jgi:hypothetical protein